MQHPERVNKSKDLFHTKQRWFTCQKQLITLQQIQKKLWRVHKWKKLVLQIGIGFDESSNCILTRVINKHMARGEITLESVCEL